MKVIDKINKGLAGGNVVFSFEFFPPKTEEGVENLYDRMDRMVMHQPAFCDITWGAGGSTSAITLDIANKMQNMVRTRTNVGLHLNSKSLAAMLVFFLLRHEGRSNIPDSSFLDFVFVEKFCVPFCLFSTSFVL